MSERTTGRTGRAEFLVRTVSNEEPLLDDEEIQTLEELHPDGMTARDVVEVFKSRGAKLSEATFRKYVQLGLLPRSRRVRRQGRRGGSLGLYPVSVIRRIIEIKRLLAQDFTMEEIRQQFLCATSEIDELEESLARVFSRLEAAVVGLGHSSEDIELLRHELHDARATARRLTDSLRGVERRLEKQARHETDVVRRVV
jgi:hypothetical protein